MIDNYNFIRRLEDFGELRILIRDLLNHPRFHIHRKDIYWHSDHELEGEKLEELRCDMSFIHDQLIEMFEIINHEPDQDED